MDCAKGLRGVHNREKPGSTGSLLQLPKVQRDTEQFRRQKRLCAVSSGGFDLRQIQVD